MQILTYKPTLLRQFIEIIFCILFDTVWAMRLHVARRVAAKFKGRLT